LLVSFDAGQTVYEAGEQGEVMYIVESGEVDLVDPLGTIANLQAGDFFGEMSLLEPGGRRSTAKAASACSLLPIDALTLDQLLKNHPEVLIRLLRKLAQKLQENRLERRQLIEELQSRVEAAAAAPAETAPAAPPPAAPEPAAPPEPAAAPPPEPEPEPEAEPEAAATDELAFLVHTESATRFPIALDTTHTIGRFDPSTQTAPDIDLTELDTGRSLSRRHARLIHRDNQYFLREEIGTANGTSVGGAQLTAGQDHPLRNGDRLRLGFVELRFELEKGA
jgi:predicted component of type VI protein secretion system